MANYKGDINFDDENAFSNWKRNLLEHEVNKFYFFKMLKGGHKASQGVWLKNEQMFSIERCYGGGFTPELYAAILHLDDRDHYCVSYVCPVCGDFLFEDDYRAFCLKCNPPYDWTHY